MDARHAFDTGDTVRLKIGGPTMTVLSGTEDACCCMWFVDAKLEHGTFEAEAIELLQRGVRLIPTEHFSRSLAARA